LQNGDSADFIVVEDLKKFNILQTYINGILVAEKGKSFIQSVAVAPINQFNCDEIKQDQLQINVNEYLNVNGNIPVIEALDGQLITNRLMLPGKIIDHKLVSNVEQDMLKMVVVNRYNNAPIAKCFIKNFGLKHGAMASSVAHDSHNIVAVGCDDESLTKAINLVIKEKGGVSAVLQLALRKKWYWAYQLLV
jgi:adenine deaminase